VVLARAWKSTPPATRQFIKERTGVGSPSAYKPIEAVIAAQSDLVEVVHELKQVLCVKG
jgi:RNA-splicing ligase RtcB